MSTFSFGTRLRSSPNRHWWALGALALSMLTIGFDTTILSVAVPTLATSLHASTGQLQWFNSSYTLVLSAVLLPAGMLGDRYGRKRFLVGALVLFGASSGWCAYVSSPDGLIAARAVLGLAAAFMMPLSMATLPVLFPDPAERARAFTIWVSSTALGLPLGPILGGWLLDHFWWGSVFLINVPMVAIGVAVVVLVVPESRSSLARPPDLFGVLLSSGGLLGLTYGLIATGQDGWSDPTALTWLGAGVLLLAAFIAWQARAPHPLVDLSFFRNRNFTMGATLAPLVNFALIGLLFVLPQYFQAILGSSPLITGVRLLPLIAGLAVGSRFIGGLQARIGRKACIATGFGLLTIGVLACATTGMHTSYVLLAIWLALVGAGVGAIMPSALGLAMDTLPLDSAGSGSAIVNTLRQAGATLGVALLGTVLNTSYRRQLSQAKLPASVHAAARASVSGGVSTAHRLGSAPLLHSVRAAFVHGADLMFLVCGLITAAGFVLALTLIPGSRPVVVDEVEPSYDLIVD